MKADLYSAGQDQRTRPAPKVPGFDHKGFGSNHEDPLTVAGSARHAPDDAPPRRRPRTLSAAPPFESVFLPQPPTVSPLGRHEGPQDRRLRSAGPAPCCTGSAALPPPRFDHLVPDGHGPPRQRDPCRARGPERWPIGPAIRRHAAALGSPRGHDGQVPFIWCTPPAGPPRAHPALCLQLFLRARRLEFPEVPCAPPLALSVALASVPRTKLQLQLR